MRARVVPARLNQNCHTALAHIQQDYKWLCRPLPSPEDCGMRISVAVMQRMYISALKVEIAHLGMQIFYLRLTWRPQLPTSYQ